MVTKIKKRRQIRLLISQVYFSTFQNLKHAQVIRSWSRENRVPISKERKGKASTESVLHQLYVP